MNTEEVAEEVDSRNTFDEFREAYDAINMAACAMKKIDAYTAVGVNYLRKKVDRALECKLVLLGWPSNVAKKIANENFYRLSIGV